MYYPLASREKADACVKKWRRIQHLEQCFSAGVYLQLRFPGAARSASIALAEPVWLETAARVGVYCLEQGLSQQPKSFEIVGLGDMAPRQNEPDDKRKRCEIQGG